MARVSLSVTQVGVGKKVKDLKLAWRSEPKPLHTETLSCFLYYALTRAGHCKQGLLPAWLQPGSYIALLSGPLTC